MFLLFFISKDLKMKGIPGNFVDKKTGETLKPVYRFQDALGIWHEKDLALCTWSELHDFCIALWNAWMSEKTGSKSVGFVDMLKIVLMVTGATTFLVAAIIIILTVIY